jgi:hypothetical protein
MATGLSPALIQSAAKAFVNKIIAQGPGSYTVGAAGGGGGSRAGAVPMREFFNGHDIDDIIQKCPNELKAAVLHEIRMHGGGYAVPSNPQHSHAAEQRAPRKFSNEEKLAMRMGWEHSPGRFAHSKFSCIHIHQGTAKVLVFVAMHDDTHVTIEDDKGLFPSDALVTSLRVLE